MSHTSKLKNPLTVIIIFFAPLAFAVGGRGSQREGVPSIEEIVTTWTVLIAAILIVSVLAIRKASSAESQGAQWMSIVFILVAMAGIIVFFAAIYTVLGLDEDFFVCLYFSMVTWSTLGYGDFAPNEATRFYAAFEAFIGYLYLGIFVSTFYKALTYYPAKSK